VAASTSGLRTASFSTRAWTLFVRQSRVCPKTHTYQVQFGVFGYFPIYYFRNPKDTKPKTLATR
jgi:hypothetical protein